MKYLNLGCGTHFSSEMEWTNLDFVSTGEGVIAHNLLNGIPFEDNSFDAVYHSHVLEHFSKQGGENLLADCFRVLKPGGIIRIAIPDLERIVRNYLLYLEEGIKYPEDEMARANYDWMLIEMYDQTVRNFSGGNMGRYLFQEKIKNQNFVFERIGEEGKALRNNYLKSKEAQTQIHTLIDPKYYANIIARIKSKIKNYLINKLKIDETAMELGRFRLGGEIHQWMYDRYSLTNLLLKTGGNNIQVKDAFTSNIKNWTDYNLDGKEGIARKPDSLFIEAIKK